MFQPFFSYISIHLDLRKATTFFQDRKILIFFIILEWVFIIKVVSKRHMLIFIAQSINAVQGQYGDGWKADHQFSRVELS